MVFAIHWHESAMDLHVFPIPIPPPASLPIPSLWVFPVHQPWALVCDFQTSFPLASPNSKTPQNCLQDHPKWKRLPHPYFIWRFFSGFPLGDPYKTSSAKKILFLKYLKNIILDDLRLFHLFSQFSVYVCLNNHILEEGHGNPLQCSGLETPMDGGAWWATVHGVAKTQTWLKQLSTHANNHLVLVRHFQLL